MNQSGAIPSHCSALITTRGAHFVGVQPVRVDALSRDEALSILLGADQAAASLDAVEAADELGVAVGRWALLVEMASRLLTEYRADSGQYAAQARLIAKLFSDDPTLLDDPASRERSIARITERSIDQLTVRQRQRFAELAVYPADARLDPSLLGDLWLTNPVETHRTIQALDRSGLASIYPPCAGQPLRLGLHDLIVAHLHRTHGPPGSKPDLHRRCADASMTVGGNIGDLTAGRARWLTYHLIRADAWEVLPSLLTPVWQAAFQTATGSDSEYFSGLGEYAAAAAQLSPERAGFEVARVVLVAARRRAVVRKIPIDFLNAMAFLDSPRRALDQAVLHPVLADAAIAQIVKRFPDDEELAEAALVALRSMLDTYNSEHSEAIGAVAGQIVLRCVARGDDPVPAAERLKAVRVRYPWFVLLSIAEACAAASPELAAELVREADNLIQQIDSNEHPADRDRAIARLAIAVAALNPTDPANRALALSRARETTAWAPVAIASRLANHRPPDRDAILHAVRIAQSLVGDEREHALATVAPALATLGPTDARLARLAARLARSISLHDAYAVHRVTALLGVADALAAKHPKLATRLRGEAIEGLLSDSTVEHRGTAFPAERVRALAYVAAHVALAEPANFSPLLSALDQQLSNLPTGDRVKGLANAAATIAPLARSQAKQWFDQARTLLLLGDQPAIEMARIPVSDATTRLAISAAFATPQDPLTQQQAEALARLSPGQNSENLSRALAAIAESRAPWDRAYAAGLLAEAIELAQTAANLSDLAALHVKIHPSDPDALTNALAYAESLEPRASVQALADIASSLQSREQDLSTDLFNRAHDLLDQLEDDRDGLRDLAVVHVAARRLAAAPLTAAAITAADGALPTVRQWIYPEWAARVVSLVASLPMVDPATLAAAQQIARSRTNPGSAEQLRALGAIAARLGALDPQAAKALLDEANSSLARVHAYDSAGARAFLAGCRADVRELEHLLRWDCSRGQLSSCLDTIAEFVEAAELTKPALVAAICRGVCNALLDDPDPSRQLDSARAGPRR